MKIMQENRAESKQTQRNYEIKKTRDDTRRTT